MNSILESNIEIINEDILKNHLYCPELPDADLIIRTGGENRLSNFLFGNQLMQRFTLLKSCGPNLI